MRRKGWWILGGILLLWISPVFYGVGSFLYRKHQKADFDRRMEAFRLEVAERLKVTITEEERAKWREQARLEKIAEEAERDRKRNAYLASPIRARMRPSSFPLTDDDDRPRTRVVHVPYPEPARQHGSHDCERQPDLTGFYWKRDFGTFQYVQGPL
jgi:cbb3-type cytochrome oxidase subunit 3